MLRKIYHTLFPLSVRTKLNLGNRLKKHSSTQVRMVENGKIIVSETSVFENRLLWVSDVNATDPISLEARSGTLTLEDSLVPILGKECCFLDVGANIGKISLGLAACGGDKKCVRGYAIEASPQNYALLTKSIYLNDFDVKCSNVGVWSKTGTIYFRQNGPYGWVCLDPEPSAFPIDVISLDDYGDSVLKDLERLDFIKIDIEGSEVAALNGASNFLRRFGYPPIFIEANAWTLAVVNNHTTADLIHAAEAHGYEVYRWHNNTWLKYDSTYFFDDVCTDYMLLHPARDNSLVGVTGGTYPQRTEAETSAFIVKKLKEFLALNEADAVLASEDAAQTYQSPALKRISSKIAFETGIAMLCNLREYPLLCQRQEIAELLPHFAGLKKKIPLLEKTLAWYTN